MLAQEKKTQQSFKDSYNANNEFLAAIIRSFFLRRTLVRTSPLTEEIVQRLFSCLRYILPNYLWASKIHFELAWNSEKKEKKSRALCSILSIIQGNLK